MKITVLGGSGFIGSHVCDKLTDEGHDVTIFDVVKSPWIKNNQKMILGDITKKDDVFCAVEGADIVYNFAGIADLDDANTKPEETVLFNILGNTHVLNACVHHHVSRYIFSSTLYVYSRAGGFYRCSKQACEIYIENFFQTFGLEYTILRFGSLYGPRATKSNAIRKYIIQALRDKQIIYCGCKDALREYIHVEDAAKGSLEILKPEYKNQNVILSGHNEISVENVFKLIREIIQDNNIRIEFNENTDSNHYVYSPYSFNPKLGKKFQNPLHIDLGQGILREIESIFNELRS